ncbi:hypothetical protein V9T40_002187 [Parthenolecanium corni]|uniref:Lipase domain-containing protein n=1 Tax=Parthenolecanium corni TaxID=536013 RepID=A0AAN9THZ8_9HEMI
MDILRRGNGVGILFFLSLSLDCYCDFIKFGPCLFGWNITCPDPHIKFYLFTRKNQYNPQEITPSENKILQSNFNRQFINKVIFHGYNGDMNLTQLLEMKDGYLKTGDFNVWMIDWSVVAAGPCYPVVVGNLNYVGTCVAQMLDIILNATLVPKDKAFHLIGFSMGAHVAAYTANHLRPYKLPRITGLDPALPLFTTSNKDAKLDKTDANFVDVLHTDALIEGKAERCGHIDFYMNGGMEQPGCWNGNILDCFQCNHVRAPAYFAESITSKVGFWGWPCKGFWHYIVKKCKPQTPTTLMGENVDYNSTGYYIVHTAAKSPYAIGRNYIVLTENQLLVRRLSSSNDVEIITYPKNKYIENLKNNSYFPEFENESGKT